MPKPDWIVEIAWGTNFNPCIDLDIIDLSDDCMST